MLLAHNSAGALSPSPFRTTSRRGHRRSDWPPPTVLVSEQDVMLLSAGVSAAPSKPSPLTRWIAAVRAAFATRPASERRAHPHDVVRHYAFLESAAMAREMEHL